MSYYLVVEKYIISLQVTNSMGKLLYFHFRVTSSMVKLLFSHFRVTIVKLINEENSLNVIVWMSVNLYKSILLLRFLRTSYNSMFWGSPGTLKSSQISAFLSCLSTTLNSCKYLKSEIHLRNTLVNQVSSVHNVRLSKPARFWEW